MFGKKEKPIEVLEFTAKVEPEEHILKLSLKKLKSKRAFY